MVVNRFFKALSSLFMMLAVAFSASVAVMLWRGQMWTCGFYVGGPRLHMLGIAFSFFGWYLFRHGIHNSLRDWLRFAGRVFLLTISLGLTLAVAEVGIRALCAARQERESLDQLNQASAQGKPRPFISEHPLASIIRPSDDERVVYELIPNLDTDFGPVRVRTNKSGLREDRDYPIDRAPNTLRIVGIGDSGMFGWDVPQNEDYLGVLESALQSRGGDVNYEVLNFGVPGYNSRLEVELFRKEGLVYRPDIVVVGWVENDYSLPCFLLQKQNFKRRDVSYVFDLLFSRRRFVTLTPGISFRDMRKYDKDMLLPEIVSGTDVEGVRSAMRDLKTMSEEHSFKILVFGAMKDPIVTICRELDIPYCNTYEKIPDTTYPKTYLIHFMHPTPDGHSILAQCLEKDLADRGWLAPAGK
jgi:hypothetical protein